MSNVNAHQETKPQILEANSPILIDSAALGKKDSLSILHVDDDLCLLEVSKQILSMENNFEIENVTSVDEAFKKLQKQIFDAVISDYEMPQKNGLEFLKELRDKKNDIAFILFTGKGREDVAVKALNLGADRYIDKNGSPETVYCELADAINKTVERKKSRELLAKSETKYRTLVENSLQGIAILLATPLRIVFSNEAMGKLVGYSSKELMSLSPEGIMSLVYHADRAVFFKRMENRMRGETAESCFEFRAVRKDGSIIWLSSLANRVEYDRQPAVQGMFLDLSESKKAEEVAKKSEVRFRELANFLPEIVFETDLSGKITFFSQNGFQISGFSPEDLEKGMNMLQFVVPEDRERAKENIRRRMAGEKSDTSEYTLFRKNGDTYSAIVKTAPIFSENRLIGLRGLVIDITESKKAEASLKESEEKFRNLAEESPNMIFINVKGKVAYANRKCVETMGYSKEEFYSPNFNFLSLVAPESIEIINSSFAMHMKGVDVPLYEYGLVTREGQRIEAIITSKLIEYNGRKAILGLVTDITERKKAEKALLESQQKFKALFSANPEAAVFLDTDSHVVEANSRFSRLFGYSFDEVKGKIINDIVVPDESKEESRIVRQKVISGPVEIVTSRRRKDGSQIPLFMSGGPVIVNGKVIGSIMVYKDISDIITVQEELGKTLDKAEMLNEKLRVVGSLTRHDVGNKLMVMKSNIYLLKKQIGDNPKLAKYLEGIDTAINHSDKMFEFSRYYEKIGVEEPSEIDVAQCFNQAATLLPNFGTIKVINDCQGLYVTADSLLKQLFYNFLDNSLKYGEEVTQIRLHFTNESDGVKLFYEDDGVGITEANKPKLFHEGFPTGKSTGLGLFLTKKMVEVYGWSITEKGEPSKGAKFVITIPRINLDRKENFRIMR